MSMDRVVQLNQGASYENGDYVVFYHDHCSDGLMSAAVFARAYSYGIPESERVYPVTLVPYSYGQDLDLSLIRETSNVYLLDVCVTDMELVNELCERAACVVSLDHHDSGIRFIEKNIFNLPENYLNANSSERSGAYLTHKYLHPDAPVNHAVQLIDDRDRWMFHLDGSEALHEFIIANIMSSPNQETKIMKAVQLLSDRVYLNSGIDLGKLLLNYRNSIIRTLIEQATIHTIEWEGQTLKYANLETPYELRSVTCTQLMKLHPHVDFVLASTQEKASISYGLRSRRGETRFNLAVMAEELGGGGHPSACGFNQLRVKENVLKELLD